MDGKTVLITGGTAGIGFQTAAALANMGADVIITGRDVDRGERAARAARGAGRVTFLAVDHRLVGENRRLAERVRRLTPQLDVLVNNVGSVGYERRTETADGHEAILATNFIGPVTLTDGLLPTLTAAGSARVVTVVSSAYSMWKGDPFTEPRRYVAIDAYARAKLLNLLATLSLARRLGGTGLVVNATNPGMAWTPGTQALTPTIVPAWRWFWPVVRFFQRRASAQKASRSSVYLASSPQVDGVTGRFFESSARPAKLAGWLGDADLQDRAWTFALELARAGRRG